MGENRKNGIYDLLNKKNPTDEIIEDDLLSDDEVLDEETDSEDLDTEKVEVVSTDTMVIDKENPKTSVEIDLEKEIMAKEERKKLKESLESVLYGENNTTEEINNNKGEDDMNLRAILSDTNTIKYKFSVNMTDVIKLAERELGVSVVAKNLEYTDFYNTFIQNCKELTPVDKDTIMKEYYPTDLKFKDSLKVHTLLIAKIPEEVLGDQVVKSTGLFWDSRNSSLREFTNKYPQYFGSQIFQPTFTVRQENGKVEYHNIISTLTLILHYLGLDVAFIREQGFEVGIAQLIQSNKLAYNELNQDKFIIEFTRN